MSTGSNYLSRNQWAKRLNAEWCELRAGAVEGFFQLGQSLLQAKTELEHGEWLEMVENDLDFNRRVANTFKRIATWGQKIGVNDSNLPIRGLLPPDYNTIAKLTSLDDDTFHRLLDDGTICPSLQRNELSRILRDERIKADERRVLGLRPREGKWRTLVLDIAWESDTNFLGRVAPLYATMDRAEILALPVASWAEDEGHLYLCTTNADAPFAHTLLPHYGFEYKTTLTWKKPPPFGVGEGFRGQTEHVLVGVRGGLRFRKAADSIATWFEGPRGEHSEKPESFYEIVRAASYPPYGEAFQRTPRPDFINLFAEIAEAAE